MIDTQEIEAVLEKIWDIHDKLSDAIHSISRSHFLNTVKSLKNSEEMYFSSNEKKKRTNREQQHQRSEDDDREGGYVFMKDVRLYDDDDAAIAEAKSLNAIRTALENLEDQLDFFHTVQLQQRAERDAAIARLEQSRIVLAMRLADHQGQRYKVIDEALAFVGDVHNAGQFISPEQLFETPRSQFGDNSKGQNGSILMQVLASSFTFLRRSLKVDQIGSVLGQSALVAVSIVALLHLQQLSSRSNFVVDVPHVQDGLYYSKRSVQRSSEGETTSTSGFDRHLDVFAARG